MLCLIVAMTENRVIGRDGDMPWRLSSDLRRFKKLTMGHTLIMGRKTYESIGRPLPGRTTIVLSRSASYEDTPIQVARDWETAMQTVDPDRDVFVTGGAAVFKISLPLIQRIYLTQIHVELEGDTFFPDVDWSQWQLIEEEHHTADSKNDFDYSFLTYDRTG